MSSPTEGVLYRDARKQCYVNTYLCFTTGLLRARPLTYTPDVVPTRFQVQGFLCPGLSAPGAVPVLLVRSMMCRETWPIKPYSSYGAEHGLEHPTHICRAICHLQGLSAMYTPWADSSSKWDEGHSSWEGSVGASGGRSL